MGRVLDTLDAAMLQIKKEPSKILKEKFMMHIFDEFINELPPFKDYMNLMFKKRTTRVIARKSGARVVPLKSVKRELFRPKSRTDKDTSGRVIELAAVAATAIHDELHDTKKATWKYLSKSGSEHSWAKCSEERKMALLGTKATNCEAEPISLMFYLHLKLSLNMRTLDVVKCERILKHCGCVATAFTHII